MLIDNTPKNIIIKFLTGEEVICKKISETVETVSLKYPLSFVMGFNPENPQKGEVSFTPWLVGSDFSTEHVIHKRSIITITSPSSTVNEKYDTSINIITKPPENKPAVTGASGPKMVARR